MQHFIRIGFLEAPLEASEYYQFNNIQSVQINLFFCHLQRLICYLNKILDMINLYGNLFNILVMLVDKIIVIKIKSFKLRCH